MKFVIALLSVCFLFCCPQVYAKETRLYLNPNKPVYTDSTGILSVELPAGQWDVVIRDSGEFRAIDSAEGDPERTEVKIASFPKGKAGITSWENEELKGYADIIKHNSHPDNGWFELTADSGRGQFVYVRCVFFENNVYQLSVHTAKSQKQSFDYTVDVVSKSFRPLPKSK